MLIRFPNPPTSVISWCSSSRLLKKTHMPTACFKQAAVNRPGKFSRSKQSRSHVPPKYASARRFLTRLAAEIFLTSLQTAFFNNLLGIGPWFEGLRYRHHG